MEDISNTRYKLYQERALVQAYLLTIDEAIDQYDQQVRGINWTYDALREEEENLFKTHIKIVKELE